MQEIIDKLVELEKGSATKEQLILEYTKIGLKIFSEIERLKESNYVQLMVRDTIYKVRKSDYEYARVLFKDNKEALKNNIAFEIGIPVSTIKIS